MLQLVNLLRLHLVLRFHILLPVLPTVIAGHLGHGTSWSQKRKLATFYSPSMLADQKMQGNCAPM